MIITYEIKGTLLKEYYDKDKVLFKNKIKNILLHIHPQLKFNITKSGLNIQLKIHLKRLFKI